MGGRSPLPVPRWIRSSSGRHAPRQRLESGDPSSAETAKKVGRKVCAQLVLSIPLISDGLRLRSIGRQPKVAARPARRGPYSLIFFGTGGCRSPLFAHNAHSYGRGSSFTQSAASVFVVKHISGQRCSGEAIFLPFFPDGEVRLGAARRCAHAAACSSWVGGSGRQRRSSRSRVSSRPTSLRMTATRATLGGLPRARSRS